MQWCFFLKTFFQAKGKRTKSVLFGLSALMVPMRFVFGGAGTLPRCCRVVSCEGGGVWNDGTSACGDVGKGEQSVDALGRCQAYVVKRVWRLDAGGWAVRTRIHVVVGSCVVFKFARGWVKEGRAR